ncbi:MAG: hypothetical protein U0271_12170 [Polyangiaceae bacterium]
MNRSASIGLTASAALMLVSCAGTSTTNKPAASTWTAVELPEAGVTVSMPCAALDAPVERRRDGAIRYRVISRGCTAGGLRYEVDYWVDVVLESSSSSAADLVADEVVRSAAASDQGWVVDRQGALDGYAKGWFAFEVGLHRGTEHRIEHHFLLLPRKVSLRVAGERLLDDDPDAKRFLGSLELREPGAASNDTAALERHKLELEHAIEFSAELPCTPTGSPVAADHDPDGDVKSRLFECRHPKANVAFNVLVARFDPPSASPPTNDRIASRLAADATRSFQAATKAPVSVGAPTSRGTTASIDFKLGANGSVGVGRFKVSYPYFASVVVLGELEQAERDQVLASLRLPGDLD